MDERGFSANRRRLISLGGAALGAQLLHHGATAHAQDTTRRYAGTTLNVACWSSPYAKWLQEYLPEFQERTGIKVAYDTPAAPIYNQRADLELSTKGSAYDVLNITFIYVSRWINAGWFTPLNEFISDRNRTPGDWAAADFLPVALAPFRDARGQLYGFPWLTEVIMGAAGRSDLFRQAGVGMPDTFDELAAAMKAVSGKDGVRGFVSENNHGWTFIPYLQGFGGNVFRKAPDDLMPTLDSPQAIAAADFYCGLLKTYGPEGALSYNYDAAINALMQGRANYATMGHIYLTRLGEPASKVSKTVSYSLCPRGPAGRFPGVASHAWGIPVGAKNKEAAWEFIKWAVSKQTVQRLLVDKGYGAVPRRSIIESADFRSRMTVNGNDLGDLFVKTIALAADGHMRYRTVHVYPQVNQLLNKAVELIVSGQASAADAMRQTQAAAVAELRKAGVAL
jgi:multiple sugar transport system substrate-binding protein